MKFKMSLFLMLSIYTSLVFSRPGELTEGRESHGGDGVGIDFVNSLNYSIDRLIRIDGTFPIEEELLNQTLKKLLVVVTDETLEVTHNEQSQVSTAINFINEAGRPVIKVNRIQWLKHGKMVREALALHELLSLHGLEKTYDYKYSNKISANIMNVSQSIVDHTCSNLFKQLSEEEKKEIFSSFGTRDEKLAIRFFVDSRTQSTKYLLDYKKTVSEMETTSDETTLCNGLNKDHFYIPVEGKVFDLERRNGSLFLSRETTSRKDYDFDSISRYHFYRIQ